MATLLGTLAARLTADTKQFDSRMGKAAKTVEKFREGITVVAKASGAAFAIGSVAIVKFISVASDAAEQLNVINEGFGKQLTPTILEWARVTSASVGRAEQDLLNFAGSTQAMLVPMLGSRDAAAEMSTNMAQLAVDLGSFFNVNDPDALAALKAGLIGSSEPMRKFGVVMTEASLSAFALSEGVTISTADMNEAQKVALRYAFIMDATATAQGDAARTSEGFANATKRIEGQFKDLAVEIGGKFLPIAEKVLAVISSLLGKFASLGPSAKTIAAILLGVGTAFAGIVLAATGLALVIPALVAGWALLGAVMTGAILTVLPIILLVSASIAGMILTVGTLKRAWDANFLGMRTTLTEFAENVKAAWLKMFGELAEELKHFAKLASLFLAPTEEKAAAFFELEQFRTRPRAEKLPAGEEPSAEAAGGPLDEISRSFKAGLGALGFDALKDTIKGLIPDMENLDEKTNANSEAMASLQKRLEALGKGTKNLGEGVAGLTDLLPERRKALEQTDKALADARMGIVQLASASSPLAMSLGNLGTVTSNLIPNLEAMDEEIAAIGRVDFDPQTNAEVIGRNIEQAFNVITDALAGVGESIASGLEMAGGIIVSNLGTFGELAKTAAQGFQAGGPIGAIIAVIADLVTRLEGFSAATDIMNEDIGNLLEALKPLGETVRVLTEAISESVEKVFAALAGVLNALVTNAGGLFNAIAEITNMINEIIVVVLEALAPIMEALGFLLSQLAEIVLETTRTAFDLFSAFRPLIDGVMKIVEVFATGLKIVFSLLQILSTFASAVGGITRSFLEFVAPAIEFFGQVIEGIAKIMNAIAKAFVDAFNAVVEIFADVASIVGLGNEVRKFKISLNATRQSANSVAEALDGIEPPAPGVHEGFGDVTDAADALKESLRNVPSGFKAELRRFQAADPELVTLGGGVEARPTIGTLNIGISSAQEFFEIITGVQEIENFQDNGTVEQLGAPFGIDRQGG